MNWDKGYTAGYEITQVDPGTWRDIDTFQITGGSITRESTGLRQSATVDMVNANTSFTEKWIRVWLDAKQTGSHTREPLFTGLATSPGDNFNGATKENQLDCYSVLKPVDDVGLLRGWYAQAGRRGGDIVKELLSVTPAPVVVSDNSPCLTSHIIAEDGETRLTMADKIIDAIGWRLRIAGDGTIYVEPKPGEISVTFDPIEFDVIETDVEVEEDWFDCPNVFLAIDDDMTAIARDDSLDSPLSTVNRGREVWYIETSCDYGADETIAEFAQRRLKEEQKVAKTADYKRRYVPGVLPGDLIRLRYPTLGLDDVFKVESQTVELTHAAETQENITSEV